MELVIGGKISYENAVLDQTYLCAQTFFGWKSNAVEGDQRSGRPISSRTPEIIEKVQIFVENVCCASLRMMSDSLNINEETIRTILHEELGKTKVCAKFVPHTLSPEQKVMGSEHCRNIISATENDPNFLKSIVIGDETWCFQYDPEKKRKSLERKSENSP
ncbi:FLJ37770-like protein [Trichonephila clavipes]|nr:FLJ37770-like protein [Trichonephila clavipes]